MSDFDRTPDPTLTCAPWSIIPTFSTVDWIVINNQFPRQGSYKQLSLL